MPTSTPSAPTPTKDPSRRLIVLIPGLISNGDSWKSLRARLEQEEGYEPEQATWFIFDYGSELAASKWLDNLAPGLRLLKPHRLDALAHRLRARIDGEWAENGGFREVVLIGHSVGGLIARRVYLLAAGAVPNDRPSIWGHRISRIVLFAAPNRGNRTNWAWWSPPLSWFLNTIPFLPHLVFEDALRGSNFLTNLRIDWIRHFSSALNSDFSVELQIEWIRKFYPEAEGQPLRPIIVQFLGDDDKLVDHHDSEDVLGYSEQEYYQRIADADHSSLYRLDLALDPEARYALIRDAFCQDKPTYLSSPPPSKRSASDDEQVVFLLHGIRATNVDTWIAKLGIGLEKLRFVVVRPEYGFFSALGFALPRKRRRNIRFFQDTYTEVLAEHPRATFHIIAHSNGTYMLGSSLNRTPGMRFKNVVLAGSALPESYQWSRLMPTQVSRVTNERASLDWPIALLARALNALGNSDIGASGFAGFHGNAASEVAYFKGGHGAALDANNHERIIKFILGDTVDTPTDLTEAPAWFRTFSNLMPYLVWALLLVVLGAIVWLTIYKGYFDPFPLVVLVITFIVIYVILDVI